jgi:hypothetical protein
MDGVTKGPRGGRPAKERSAVIRKNRRANGQCIRCGINANGFFQCEECRGKSVRRTANWKSQQKELGRCSDCGGPRGEEQTYCESCRNRRRHGHIAARPVRLAYAKKKRTDFALQGLCLTCGGTREDAAYRLCAICRDHQLLRRRRMVAERQLSGLCVYCGHRPPDPGGSKCEACRVKNREYGKRRKDLCFSHYGGYICSCCGETEEKFLTLDHIHNDGAAHRRHMNGDRRYRGTSIYGWLIRNRFPAGFQVLCFNCNCGKHLNGGICPHEAKRRAAAKS